MDGKGPAWRRMEDVPPRRLPHRTFYELVSERTVGASVGCRVVEIDREDPSDPRHAHVHRQMEEVIVVLSGEGRSWVEGETRPLGPGDSVWVPAGMRHMTVNTGAQPLRLLCFFSSGRPEDDIEECPDVRYSAKTPGQGGADE